MIAVAMGTIIIAVAVLLIHAEIKAVAAMNPAIVFLGLVPIALTINKKRRGPSTRPTFCLEII